MIKIKKRKKKDTLYFGTDLAGIPLTHYGTPRHSGRYPWGSGENPYQHTGFNRSLAKTLKKQGLTEKQIAERMGLSTTQYRAEMSLAKDAERAAKANQALRMADKGYSRKEICRKMGIPESTLRTYLDPAYTIRSDKTKNCASMLKSQVDSKGYIDVSSGTELDVGVSRTRMKTAIAMLEKEGYEKYYIQVPQMGTGKKTSMMVLCPPGTEYKELYSNRDQIKTIAAYSGDDGYTIRALKPPKSISSDRVMIRYAEEGGKDMDGVMQIRRGVEDLSLGKSRYAQVRIGVDGTHYLKGMAVYADDKDMPPGVDIIFNTNKHKGTPMIGEKDHEVLKRMKINKETGEVDKDNPFGATIKADGQLEYVDADGKTQLGCVNIVNEEGDWGKWSKTLSSQFLSKQYPRLAKRQLDLAYADKMEEYESIMNLTNPTVKKQLLDGFASDCDASAVHLKAAAIPGQQSHVILPLPEIKENEIYAPNYPNGTQLALVRHPHEGVFQIPILTVNNDYKPAKELLGNAKDAVGIHPQAAEQLSGADFDGDTVLCIPTTNSKIRASSPLKGLIGFDPKEEYPYYEGMKCMSKQNKQIEMGKISNLITDMTLQGAPEEELCRAVKHSMTVIDSEKHRLNYKLSEEVNGIAALKDKYQNGGGASTLISRAKSRVYVDDRKENFKIDPDTGEKVWEYTGKTYIDKSGKEKKRQKESKALYEATDAYELSTGTRIENIYAEYSNQMKALANKARKSYLETPNLKYDPAAKKEYAEEVSSLERKLVIAEQNRPRERQAQLLAGSYVAQQKQANPDMDKDDLKKLKSQALAGARMKTGAHKERVTFTDREWEAVQKGAISNTKLRKLLRNADMDEVKQRAMPRNQNEISSAKKALIKSMQASGYSTSEIAARVGVSAATVNKYS